FKFIMYNDSEMGKLVVDKYVKSIVLVEKMTYFAFHFIDKSNILIDFSTFTKMVDYHETNLDPSSPSSNNLDKSNLGENDIISKAFKRVSD
ncbi:unnamed protein product, partial [Dovyalis caffra]